MSKVYIVFVQEGDCRWGAPRKIDSIWDTESVAEARKRSIPNDWKIVTVETHEIRSDLTDI
jgi:hypothetical protein